MVIIGFPGSSASKQSTCNAEDPSSIPGLGQFPGGGHGNPIQYSCLKNPTEEPGGLQSTGWQRIRHDWMTKHTQLIRKSIEKEERACIDSQEILTLEDQEKHAKAERFWAERRGRIWSAVSRVRLSREQRKGWRVKGYVPERCVQREGATGEVLPLKGGESLSVFCWEEQRRFL